MERQSPEHAVGRQEALVSESWMTGQNKEPLIRRNQDETKAFSLKALLEGGCFLLADLTLQMSKPV